MLRVTQLHKPSVLFTRRGEAMGPFVSSSPLCESRFRAMPVRAIDDATPSTSGADLEEENVYVVTREETMQEYAQLKESINRRTLRFGAGLTLYLLLAASTEAAVSCMAGVAASMLYLQLLYRDIDNYQPGQKIPIFEAEMEIRTPFQRNLTKVLLAWPQALLNPRLLVPIALAASTYFYNQSVPEEFTLSRFEQGMAFVGFVSYKPALLLFLYDAYKPQPQNDKDPRYYRPQLAEVEDLTEKVEFKNPKIKNLKM